MAGFTKEARAPARVPRLETGDRLTRPEFERRYRAMPEGTRAELVEGVVYLMTAPVRHTSHGGPHADLGTCLGTYAARTPGVEVSDNATVRLDLDNEPQPDLFLRVFPEWGGQSRTSSDGYVEDAPELVAEISASSVSIDLNDKLRAYRRNGVLEYLVWRTEDGELDWFVLENGEFEPLEPGEDGILRSRIFPGLWLDRAALLARDMARVLDVAALGIASPEHAAFVERLGSSRRPS